MTVRVLMVDDSASDAKLVASALRRSHPDLEIDRVEDADAMRAALEGASWDVVLCDWALPRFGAPAALQLLRSTGLDLPFIILTGTITEDLAVEAMRAGVQDYVLKSNLSRLSPAIERELRETKVRREQRQALDALSASEARFTRLAESGIIGIAIADPSGRVIEANDAYLQILGFARDDLRSGAVNWLRLTPPEFTSADERTASELDRTGVSPVREKELLRKDGSRAPVLVGVAKLEDGNDIAFVVDLAERKRVEKALQATESQLRHAQKMEAVGRLAGGIAHDFNNVLSVILSYSDLLLGDMSPEDPMRQDIEEIRQAGTRAADLTRQLLAFSRQQVMEPRVIDLNDLVMGTEKMLRRILGEDVDLVLTCASSLPRISVDPGGIEQVLMNLVVNARDAMPTGGSLTIETADVVLDEEFVREHVGVRAGPHVMLAVTDSGVGMDAATQARIFEPFFTTKETGKGTGLGLSTVFGIVQQSGGTVWVYSEPGVGTTLKVYLPRVDSAVEPARASVDSVAFRGSETVLLVEDEDQVRAVTLGILRRHGYHVLEARNAGEALLLCQSTASPIHLLLSDVVMPQMSGPELAKRLRALRPEMRVLCMSGYTDDSVVRHGILGAEIPFLQKPITPGTLTRKVREVLGADG